MSNRLSRRFKNLAKRAIQPIVRKYTLPFARMVAVNLKALPPNAAFDIFLSHNFHLLPKHYYSPIPTTEDTPDSYWQQSSSLPGVDMNDRSGLDLIENVFPKYMPEFRKRFPIEKTNDPAQFALINGAYMAVDAHVYYCLLRHFKPRRIVEIGSGNSTLLACAALQTNHEETGKTTHFTAVEPYPWDLFKKPFPGLTELLPIKLQDVPLSVFESLEANDILFIDSSHVLRAGNDVEYEYLEILPRLKPGVMVHVHDISLPRRYPKVYFDNQLYWNEQQLLQAFLAFNSRFEVLWAGNYMLINHPKEVLDCFPEMNLMRQKYPQSEPTAFWMRSK